MKYLGESLKKASSHCVEELRKDEGIGGVIALDIKGNGECCFALPRVEYQIEFPQLQCL